MDVDVDDSWAAAASSNMMSVTSVFPRYHRVQSALTLQSSELQDTRMLTEFLERVELEESQDGCQYSLGQVRGRGHHKCLSPAALSHRRGQ